MRTVSALAAGLLFFFVSVPAQAQEAYDIGMRQKAAERFDEARVSFRAACDSGSGKACAEYGRMLENGIGGARDLAAAKTSFGKACAADIGDGCSGRGTILTNEDAFAAAEPLLAKGCDLGSTRGCSNLGLLYQQGKLGSADYAKAARYYEKSCALGSGVGCHNRAILVRDGLGEPADRSRAYELLVANCEAKKNANSCLQAGGFLGKGNYDKKIKFFGVACDNDIQVACFNLGVAHENRIARGKTMAELERDRDLGEKAFAKACRLGDRDGCGKKARILATDRNRVWSAQAKRALVAYRPRNHGCDFSKFVWYEDNPASVAAAKNRLYQEHQCVDRWRKAEANRLNSIVQNVGGSVRYSDQQTTSRVPQSCKCKTEFDAAWKRYGDENDRINGIANRRVKGFNRDLAS